MPDDAAIPTIILRLSTPQWSQRIALSTPTLLLAWHLSPSVVRSRVALAGCQELSLDGSIALRYLRARLVAVQPYALSEPDDAYNFARYRQLALPISIFGNVISSPLVTMRSWRSAGSRYLKLTSADAGCPNPSSLRTVCTCDRPCGVMSGWCQSAILVLPGNYRVSECSPSRLPSCADTR